MDHLVTAPPKDLDVDERKELFSGIEQIMKRLGR
jgi:hypothetical protein